MNPPRRRGLGGARASQVNKTAERFLPIREAVIWAYMQNNCRPGLPDRDFVLWTQQIWDEIN